MWERVRFNLKISELGYKDFIIDNAAGTYSLSSQDSALFQVNQTTGAISMATDAGELDFDNPRDAILTACMNFQ